MTSARKGPGMTSLRTLLWRNPRLTAGVLALVLCLRALIPAGYMITPPERGELVLKVMVCAAMPGMVTTISMPLEKGKAGNGDAPGGTAKGDCVFAHLLQPALGGAPAVQLIAALAVIMLLGLVPQGLLSPRRIPFLRPHLRGPPLHV